MSTLLKLGLSGYDVKPLFVCSYANISYKIQFFFEEKNLVALKLSHPRSIWGGARTVVLLARSLIFPCIKLLLFINVVLFSVFMLLEVRMTWVFFVPGSFVSKGTRCTRGVRVVFSRARIRYRNSARMNKFNCTT